MVRIIPLAARPGEDAAEIIWKALPVALYLSILLTLSYSARKNMAIPFSIIWIIILGCFFSIGGSIAINRTGALQPALNPVPPIRGESGLVLSRSDNVIVLLKESSEIRGPRVVSIPGRPLIYQEIPLGPYNSILNLPDLPFDDNTPWIIRSLDIDLSLSAGEIKNRLEESIFSFSVYIFSLVLLLSSLRFILELSQWHLANLFLGALVFRSILALEIFLNTREIKVLISSFLDAKVPSMLITPLVFCALGILIIFYTLLTRIVRKVSHWSRRSRDE